MHTPDSPTSTSDCPAYAACMSIVKYAVSEHALHGVFYRRRFLFISTALRLQPIRRSARTYRLGKVA